MKKVIVYDFDKTLTDYDTIYPFFRHLRDYVRPVSFASLRYFAAIMSHKMGALDNEGLKQKGLELFGKGIDEEMWKQAGESFARAIRLNSLYQQFLADSRDNEVFIVSASFSSYLRPLFPSSVTVIASEVVVEKNQLFLHYNCYREKKLHRLKTIGIEAIDEFYTDSFSDDTLASIAKTIHIVHRGKIRMTGNYREYRRYFGV
jgi:phosphoserine phosphatase